MMQHSSEKSQANPDVWANGGDSHVMTIEYLRARLLSERTISKAANERADELSKRVKDLEDQLKDVSLQRKRAEKATLDVLSYLESRGVTDLSDLYESESDQEDSLSDTKTVKNNGDKNFGSLQSNENGKESSGSDHESVPSSTGSLSWKGRKKIAQVFEKKYIDSPIRRQISSPLANSSPRRRHGKSCRQIKRRDTRSVVEEPSHDLLKSDVQEYQDSNMLEMSDHDANCLDTMGNKLKQSPEKRAEVDLERSEGSPSFHDRAQAGDASSSNQGNERSGEMERALKHQAQLIGFYEAQEKAQRDWEDKYGDNHASTQDSYEPGSHSDVSHVTEELDENKAGVSLPVEVTGDHDDKLNSDKGVSETNFQTKYSSISHFNSFKLSLDADTGRKDSDQLRETHSSRSPTVDFAFPTVNTSQPQNHEDGQSSHTSKTAFSSDSHPETINENGSIFPHEDPRHSGSILNALQKAKLLLKQQMLGLPKSLESAHREIKPSIPAINNAGFLNVPMPSPGLFMVPTDLSFKSPNNSRTLPGSYDYERSSHLYGSHSMSSPVMDSRFMTAGGDTFSSKPRYATEHGNPTRHGLAFQSSPSHASSSKSRLLPYSSSPDLLSSSNQTLFSQLPRSEVGVPPSGIPLFYDHVVQPNVYSS